MRPALSVLFAGSWEQYDREVDGKVLVAGTKEWTDDLAARFAAELTSLSASSGHVAFANDHCHLTPDLGVGPEPHIVNDDKRVADVNLAVNQAIASVRFPVTLVDMNDFLCHDGYTNVRNGVTLRQDGLHFTPAGARIVWAWLGPQLRTAAQS
jgi:lysophospholipase L1-like esterase